MTLTGVPLRPAQRLLEDVHVPGGAPRAAGSVRILVLKQSCQVAALARSSELDVLGVTARGRVVVKGPIRRLRGFTDKLCELVGQPVEVLPASVQAHAAGDHDLARLTSLEATVEDSPGTGLSEAGRQDP